ncbi:MAG: hypothetical protein FD123_610 [Bacteroidetes bacterium]|nr:MAG: hypothetical protein FD123_610 [Bacteroidota bacterium]
MKQKLLLLFLAATFSLKAQTKVKFSPAQFAGTWKCIAQQWDSAGKKITRKETSRYTYSFSPKGSFIISFDCKDCPGNTGGQSTIRGTWKLNTSGDSIVYTVKDQLLSSDWADKIISVTSTKMALRIPSEMNNHMLVLEKQPALTSSENSRMEIIPKE